MTTQPVHYCDKRSWHIGKSTIPTPA